MSDISEKSAFGRVVEDGNTLNRSLNSKDEIVSDEIQEITTNNELVLTEDEEALLKTYLRKVDLRLALFICLGYMMSFLTRVALTQAKPVGVAEDLHMSDITVALSMFYISYLIFQVPSNIVLKYVKPSLWLSFLACGWSITCTLGALTKNGGGLIAVRFFIGMFQAGFTSGVVAVYASWYPRAHIGKRLGWMYSSANIASTWAGPAAAGLGSINSDRLKPYQILFIFYGCISLAWSITAFFVIKDYPDTCKYISEEERVVIKKIMVYQGTHAKTGEFSRIQFVRAILDWRLWAWSIIGFCANVTSNTGPMFGPIFTVEMGFNRVAGQGMSAIPNFISFLVAFFSSDIIRLIGSTSYTIVCAEAVSIAGLIMVTVTTNSAARFVGLCIFSSSSMAPVPAIPSWAVSNQSGTTKTAIASAIVPAISAFGGFATSYMYPSKDGPRYIHGHITNIAICAFAAIATVLMRFSLVATNNRREKEPRDISHLTAEEEADLGDRHPAFRYRI